MTADPYEASGGAGDPSSWNRYPYTRQDPINRFDPSGLVTGTGLMPGIVPPGGSRDALGLVGGGSSNGGLDMAMPEVGDGETEQGGPTGVGTGSTFEATNTAAWNVVKKIRAGFDPAKKKECLKGLSNVKVGGKSVFTADNVERLTQTWSAAGGVFFMDGTQSAMNVNYRPPGSSRALNMRANQAFESDPTLTAIRSGDAILLRPGIEGSGYFSGTILHELLHLMGASDPELRNGLLAAGWDVERPDRYGIYPRATHDLSKALNEKCF